MLFNVSYKDSQSNVVQLNVSANSISNVVLYCDANQINPLNIAAVNNTEVVLNVPNSDIMYQVSLVSGANLVSAYFVYDTWDNLLTWISQQSGKSVQNISKQTRAFVSA